MTEFTIYVDALPGGEVVIGLHETMPHVKEDGEDGEMDSEIEQETTTVSFTLPADKAVDFALLLLDRAESSKALT